MGAFLYILRCADGSYYTGTTRVTLEKRFSEHANGLVDGYTACRRPLILVFQQEFDRIEDAIAAERQVKGWRREKKEALIRGDYSVLPSLSKRAAKPTAHPSRRALSGAPQDGDCFYWHRPNLLILEAAQRPSRRTHKPNSSVTKEQAK